MTNAAVLLLGKEEILERFFPQVKVMLEYRNTESQITFDSRKSFSQPFYLLIDKLWNEVNLRNGSVPMREGAYIFEISIFNEDVIREAINNAIAHRDYRSSSEIVIKQFPSRMEIVNAGGFPNGVTLDNLLTVPSTPRNRLLADVLAKTGIVERSGQGVDKIFYYTISEGKELPDYSKSDDFHVQLSLSGTIRDKAFALFIKSVQESLVDENMLSVFEILTLSNIRENVNTSNFDKRIINRLLSLQLIEKRGKTNAQYYILSRNYYEFSDNLAVYSTLTDWDINQFWAIVSPYIRKYSKAKKSDFIRLVGSHVSDKKLRNYLEVLRRKGYLRTEGQTASTTYYLDVNSNRSKVLDD